jgi:anti-sigma-K factor RskA/putative zinc finger protein
VTEIHESTGSYAVDALDAAELAEFEAHLATCPVCRDEVSEFCEVAAELSLLTPATPPTRLRDSVLTTIRSTPQLPALNGAVEHPPSVALDESRPAIGESGPALNGSHAAAASWPAVQPVRPRRALPGSEAPEEHEEPAAPGDELTLRRQRRRSRVLSGLVAAMLALAVGLGGVVYTLVQERQAQVAQTTLEQQLYAAPDAVTTTSPLPGGGQVTFIASRLLNRALFLGTDLPDPGQNRYQLWTATGTDLQNLTGVARDVQVAETGSGIKVFFSGNVATADFLAVNLEPAGSTPDAPTSSVLAAGPTTV